MSASTDAPAQLRLTPPTWRRLFARVLTGALLGLLAAEFLRFMMAAFPRMSAEIGLLLAAAILLVGVNVAHQLRQGRRYALINVYSGIFVTEFVVGTFVATARADVMNKQHLSSASVTAALMLAVAGYIVLLCGYHLPGLVRRRPPAAAVAAAAWRPSMDFPPRYRLVLFVFLAATIGLGFIQLMLRVKQAGGFAAYLAVAYTLRYGTYADNDVSNAWAVLASMLASGALPAAALLFIAWMRGRLTTVEKWLLLVLTFALLARQASTAFRAVVVFTLISAFAVYDSERRVSWEKVTVGGLLILLLLVGVNYLHVMLHTLTGLGTTTSFGEATQDLLAPHAYLERLVSLMEASTRLEPLNGTGMLTSILFFVPRAVWTTKLPSDEYGTTLVQAWAGLHTHYQMAITNIGELFAQFGTPGLFVLFFWGLLYRWLDDHWEAGLEWRVALLCIALPRVFPDQGMGLSALMISIMALASFLGPLAVAKRFAGVRHVTPSAP